MKKLGKLSINLDKIIKNEELVNLRGGDYYGSINCYCKDETGYIHWEGTITDCENEDRWVRDMCWDIHEPYSYCECQLA